MHSSLKTCRALTSPLTVRLLHSLATAITTRILLGPTTLAHPAPGSQEVSANELARRMVSNELKFQAEDHGHWKYRQEKEESGKKQVKEILETKDGDLASAR